MTRLSVCGLGVSCNEMNDTPMLLVVIFNHFHGKKSSQKIINKHEFFHGPFYNAALPLIYLNIDVMDT